MNTSPEKFCFRDFSICLRQAPAASQILRHQGVVFQIAFFHQTCAGVFRANDLRAKINAYAVTMQGK